MVTGTGKEMAGGNANTAATVIWGLTNLMYATFECPDAGTSL